MPNVLIRGVPIDDLEEIRSAAAEQGTSLQNDLLEAVRAQAAYLRRQAALAKIAKRLQACTAVLESERAAVLDAVDAAHGERGDQLGNQRAQ